jgi:hypothetical protein
MDVLRTGAIFRIKPKDFHRLRSRVPIQREPRAQQSTLMATDANPPTPGTVPEVSSPTQRITFAFRTPPPPPPPRMVVTVPVGHVQPHTDESGAAREPPGRRGPSPTPRLSVSSAGAIHPSLYVHSAPNGNRHQEEESQASRPKKRNIQAPTSLPPSSANKKLKVPTFLPLSAGDSIFRSPALNSTSLPRSRAMSEEIGGMTVFTSMPKRREGRGPSTPSFTFTSAYSPPVATFTSANPGCPSTFSRPKKAKDPEARSRSKRRKKRSRRGPSQSMCSTAPPMSSIARSPRIGAPGGAATLGHDRSRRTAITLDQDPLSCSDLETEHLAEMSSSSLDEGVTEPNDAAMGLKSSEVRSPCGRVWEGCSFLCLFGLSFGRGPVGVNAIPRYVFFDRHGERLVTNTDPRLFFISFSFYKPQALRALIRFPAKGLLSRLLSPSFLFYFRVSTFFCFLF